MKIWIEAEMSGVLAAVSAVSGAIVQEGDSVGEIECMKSFWPIVSPSSGILTWLISLGDMIGQDQIIATVEKK